MDINKPELNMYLSPLCPFLLCNGEVLSGGSNP